MELHAIKAYYTFHEGMVELDDDVLSIVRQTRELFGDRVKICWEPTSEHFVFSEMCEDGTERLIFVCEELDPRALGRLIRADGHARGHKDPYDAAEREQDDYRRESEERDLDRVRAGGEMLAHALKKDGVVPHLPLSVSIPREV